MTDLSSTLSIFCKTSVLELKNRKTKKKNFEFPIMMLHIQVYQGPNID